MKSLKDRLAQTKHSLNRLHELQESTPSQQRVDSIDQRRPVTSPGKALLWAVQSQQINKLEERIKFLEAHAAGTEIALELLHPNPFQPRKEFNEEAMDDLIGSIKQHGLIQPIIVRQHPDIQGHYQIIAGARRFRAHQKMGLEKINTIVANVDDESLAEWALVENLARKDLSDYEAARCVLALRSRHSQSTELAERLGISRTQLYRLYAYKKLPKFVLDDLDERPFILSACAANKLASLIKNNPAAVDAIQDLWPRFKAGQFKQNKLVAKVRCQVFEAAPAIRSRASTVVFAQGRKIAALHNDSDGLRLTLQPGAVSDEIITALNDMLAKAFPKFKEAASNGNTPH